MTAKLVSINLPEALPFEKATTFAKNDLLKEKTYETIETLAKKEIEDLKDTKDLGYIGRDDIEKIDMLEQNEAIQFLNHLFTQTDKKGYYIFKDKAVVYEISDQKLFDEEKFAKKKDDIEQNAKNLKDNSIQKALIEKLEKTYTIEKYFKG